MHILLVDDDPENSTALAAVLKTEGYEVDLASDGYEALEVMRTGTFDAVISDALMPRMDGYVLCKELRSNGFDKDLPFIMLTGEYTGADDERFAKSVGVTKVIRKTGNVDELIQALGGIAGYTPLGNGEPRRQSQLNEEEYLKEYNSVLFRKLEAKMAELEGANRRLVERNSELECERNKYRQLFDFANDGILLVDQVTNQIVEANLHAVEILQMPEDSIIGRCLDEFKPFGELLAHRISSGEKIRVESFYDFGETRTVLDLSGGPVGTDDKLYLIIFRNVTSRKEWLERFIALDKLRTIGRLSSGLVHEIRNPLNVVSVSLQYLNRVIDPASPEKKFTMQALDGVKGIEKVIRETMNFTQPQVPAKSFLRLSGLLNEISGLAKTSLQKGSIRLAIERGEVDDTIFADKSQTLHALLNIVENSIEAMPQGGKLIFKIEDSEKGDETILRVIDTGVGMNEDVVKAATEPFYSTKTATGMGLSISNRLFELNDARLTIESKIGIGTTVTVRFRRRS